MNFITFNVRGCSNSIKQRRIKNIMLKGKADVCFIQESKFQKMVDNMI